MNIAREFRVGNIVNRLGEPTRITAIEIGLKDIGYVSTTRSGAVTTNQIEPIPLTEEILLKCELEKDGNGYNFGNFNLCVGNDGYELYFNCYEYQVERVIKYLHELQNIYHSIKNEELKINL